MRALHGEHDQSERAEVMAMFKKQEIPILVATDVAGLGARRGSEGTAERRASGLCSLLIECFSPSRPPVCGDFSGLVPFAVIFRMPNKPRDTCQMCVCTDPPTAN